MGINIRIRQYGKHLIKPIMIVIKWSNLSEDLIETSYNYKDFMLNIFKTSGISRHF